MKKIKLFIIALSLSLMATANAKNQKNPIDQCLKNKDISMCMTIILNTNNDHIFWADSSKRAFKNNEARQFYKAALDISCPLNAQRPNFDPLACFSIGTGYMQNNDAVEQLYPVDLFKAQAYLDKVCRQTDENDHRGRGVQLAHETRMAACNNLFIVEKQLLGKRNNCTSAYCSYKSTD